MDPIPRIMELSRDDRLVVEFDQSWILEFEKCDSIEVHVRPVGRRVIPTEKTFHLADEDVVPIDDLFRSLTPPLFIMKASTSYTICLKREDAVVSSWKFEGVIPRGKQLRGYSIILKMCMSIRPEYRDPSVAERIREAPMTVLIGLLFFVVAPIVWFVSWPFRRLYRLMRF